MGTTHDFGAPSYNFEDALRHSDLCNGQDDYEASSIVVYSNKSV